MLSLSCDRSDRDEDFLFSAGGHHAELRATDSCAIQRDQHTNAGRVDSLTCWFIDSLISQPRTLKLWSLKISKELNLENSRNMRHRGRKPPQATGHGGLRTVLSSASLCYLKRHHIYEKCRKYNGKCCKKYQKVISILLTSLWLDYDNMAD